MVFVRSALADLIAAAPERQAVVVGQVRTDAADIDKILIGRVERHGILVVAEVVDQTAARRSGNGMACLADGHGLVKSAV